MQPRTWTESQLRQAVLDSTSIRQTLRKLSLKEAGGNYAQIKKYLHFYNINTSHFRGQVWNKGLKGIGKPRIPLEKILTKGCLFQSHKLKKRLFKENLKQQSCEECGWAKESPDGRIPLELNHINGNYTDNRIENLRILCPNCHSLKPTHRGRNRKNRRSGGETGIHATLKML